MTDPRLLPSACHDGIGTPDCIAFAAQYLACTCPCQRFAYCLTAVSRACLGGSVDRYSFTVTDLHRLPPAGLPAHRGSIPHPTQSLCTLRAHRRRWPRNTRYQADATPYLGRTSTGWIAPACGWRTHSITSSARLAPLLSWPTSLIN